jgi:hypothetical protein
MQKEQINNLIDDLKKEVLELKQRTAHLENRITSLREEVILLADDSSPHIPTDVIQIDDFPLVLDCVKELFNIAMYYCDGDFKTFNPLTFGNLYCETSNDFNNLVYELANLLQPTMYKEEVINAMQKYAMDRRTIEEFMDWKKHQTK